MPIKFVGFGDSQTIPCRTPVRLFCNLSDSEYTVSSVTNFFGGFGNFGKSYFVDAKIDQYNKDNQNYTVWNTGKKYSGHAICGFYCSVCEANELESVFEINSSNLFNGGIPCYCSKKYDISGEHVVEMTKRKVQQEGLEGISVIWAYLKGRNWRSVFLCGEHGVYSRRYSGLIKSGCHCLKCTPPKNGYDRNKQGYLYLLEIQSLGQLILGYGITNKLNNRLTTHRKNLKSIGATVTNIQVFEGSGTAVLAVENAIKSLHTTGLLDCAGFRRESINIDMKDKVLEKCKKLKQLDNSDKLI